MANVKPLSDKVILKPIQKDETTASGIVLPDTVSKEKPEEAEVIAVGPGKSLDNGSKSDMSVAVGDKVLFTKYGPTEVKIDGEELLIASIDDILAIVE